MRSYVSAWKRGDHAVMHRALTDDARRRFALLDFTRLHRAESATATASRLIPGAPREADGAWRVPVTVETRVFGTIRATAVIPLEGEGDEARIAWGPHLAFPGVPEGEHLERETRLPERASLLARDGTPLASGAGRASPLGAAAAAAAGELGRSPPERAEELRALGVPADAQVGISGLERILDARLIGRPGRHLRAGGEVLAISRARAAQAVRTTIAPSVQDAALTALAGRLGGIVALKPHTGEILGFAGIAFSGLQPPGSTFKIITLTGALEAGVVKLSGLVPGPDGRHALGRRAPERQPRVVRRDADAVLR